jgi:F-type H+-transporting ATPase subunit gamma
MRRPSELAADEAAMMTLVMLTSAFEGIASLRISQTKSKVLQSTEFFNELWGIYAQLRVDDGFNFGRNDSAEINEKELLIIITAEGGFSGDIDQKLLKLMLADYSKEKNDILVVGHHGAIQLAQRSVEYIKYYKLPSRDERINSSPIVATIQKYRSTVIYYQEYISLMNQEVKKIELTSAVRNRAIEGGDEVIDESTYIFEPNAYAVTAHLERSMMQIAISQLILESKLAQYASRFKAMSASHKRSDEERAEIHLNFNRSKRAIKDQRLKEIMNGLKKIRAGAA